jgi:uncharacterized protein
MQTEREFVRHVITTLSPKAEFTIVLVAAFGPLIALSTIDAASRASASLTDNRLWLLFVYELVVGGALLAFLRVRGWPIESIAPRPGLKDAVIGLGLALATLVCIALLFVVTAQLFPGAPMGLEGGAVAGQLGFATIVFVSVVNPVFEEFFVNAYLISSLTKQDTRLATALAVGIGVRLLYHSYLGAVVAPLVLIPMGLIFGYAFARQRRLWPAALAHAVTDFASLGGLAYFGVS